MTDLVGHMDALRCRITRTVLLCAALTGALGAGARGGFAEDAAQRAGGKTWYVSTDGKDNAAGTEDEPFGTIQKGVDAAKPGDTVFVRGGTYRETVFIKKSGVQGNPVTIRNYPGEQPVIEADLKPSTVGWKMGFFITGPENRPVRWIVIEGFEIRNGYNGIYILNGDHLIIRGNKIFDSRQQGILGNGHRVLIDRNIIARNGLANGDPLSNKEHGIYMAGTFITITNNIFYSNQAYGIQVAGYTDSPQYAGKEYEGATDWVISNNTFAFHKIRGPIVLWKKATKRCLIQNNIFYKNAAPDITDYTEKGSGHVIRNNFSGDPLFVNAESYDFRLRPGSPAIGAGTAEKAPSHDFLGRKRNKKRISAGAYEGPAP